MWVEVLRWVWAISLVLWFAGWWFAAVRLGHLPWRQQGGPGCIFGIVWMALGLFLMGVVPKWLPAS